MMDPPRKIYNRTNGIVTLYTVLPTLQSTALPSTAIKCRTAPTGSSRMTSLSKTLYLKSQKRIRVPLPVAAIFSLKGTILGEKNEKIAGFSTKSGSGRILVTNSPVDLDQSQRDWSLVTPNKYPLATANSTGPPASWHSDRRRIRVPDSTRSQTQIRPSAQLLYKTCNWSSTAAVQTDAEWPWNPDPNLNFLNF